jgi:hypothetical protein
LRTLLLAVTACAVLLASFRAHWVIGLYASLVYAAAIIDLADKRPRRGALPKFTTWTVVLLFFLFVLLVFMAFYRRIGSGPWGLNP